MSQMALVFGRPLPRVKVTKYKPARHAAKPFRCLCERCLNADPTRRILLIAERADIGGAFAGVDRL